MVDLSYFLAGLPENGAALDWAAANAIEDNVRYLITCWPAFEVEPLADSVGSYGYLQAEERASPAQGAEVTLLQHLPRLLVILTGTGLENLVWTGESWAEAEGPGLTLGCVLPQATQQEAMAALRRLVLGCGGTADVTVSLAAERLDGSLRIVREGVTRLLFRAGATWGLARAKKLTWGGAKPLTWGKAAALRKD